VSGFQKLFKQNSKIAIETEKRFGRICIIQWGVISETILPLCERLQDLESWATRFPEFFARQLERVRLSFSPGCSPEYESIGGRGRSNALGDNYDNIKVCHIGPVPNTFYSHGERHYSSLNQWVH